MRCPRRRGVGINPTETTARPRDLQIGFQGVRLAVGDTTQDCGLFNNAVDGSYLVVWDVTFVWNIESGSTVGFMSVNWGVAQQRPVNLPTPGFPLIPNAKQGYGIIYSIPNTPALNAVPYTSLLNQGLWQWPHDWPMCYIPSGYSLIVEFGAAVTAGAVDAQASWMWQSGVRLP